MGSLANFALGTAMTVEASPTRKITLRRSLTVGQLTFYGSALIVGAGIYVAVGSVIGRAGATAPVSLLLAGI